MTDESKWQRVVVLLPVEIAEEFKRLCAEQYTDMSSVGRELILQWVRNQEASSISSRTKSEDT